MSIARNVVLGWLFVTLTPLVSAGTMAVRWDAVAGASGYRVYWGTVAGRYTNQATVTTTATTLNLADSTRWYVGVKAYNAQGESSTFSNEVAGLPRPTVTSVTPNRGAVGQRLIVTLGGTNFGPGMTVKFLNAGIRVNGVTAVSTTTCTADITLVGPAATGIGIEVVRLDRVFGTRSGMFTMDPGPNTAAPTITSVRPLAGALGVPTSVVPTIRFSEPMARTSITTSTVRLLNDAGQNVAMTSGYPYLTADGLVVTLKPASPLLGGKVYRVQVIGGSTGVKDAGGMAMASTWTQSPGFTTVLPDTTAPRVQYANPLAGSTGVSTLVRPTVYFSEPMLASSILPTTVRVLNASGGVVAQATGYPVLSADGLTATLKPANALVSGAQYRVHVVGGSGGVKDRSGNVMAGDWGQSAWTTGTSAMTADMEGPVVTGVEATPSSPTSVQLTWNTNEVSSGEVLYRTADGETYLDAGSVSSPDLQHQVTVAGLLPETRYSFYVRSVDRAGNPSTSTPDVEAVTDGNENDYLMVEAESGDLVGGLAAAGGEGASGGAWIEAPAGLAPGAEPTAMARFTVTVPRVAAWYLWLRVRTTAGQAGWAAAANGGAWEVVPEPAHAGWAWVRLPLGKLVPGDHQIDLGALTSGTRLDTLVLTQDPSFGVGARGTATPPARRTRAERQEVRAR
ncbi:MAG TPA: Ig-like domain-containing protein [Candidatus Polarisedimenticolaceae bacterium]|nr:Ig-like domain-containing protein [Candidatus Polarisedimenticolaceae bacterium]